MDQQLPLLRDADEGYKKGVDIGRSEGGMRERAITPDRPSQKISPSTALGVASRDLEGLSRGTAPREALEIP